MRNLVRALLAIALLLPLLRGTPAHAESRVQWWYSENPPSPWMNTASRFRRLGSGQWMLDSLGRASNGWYSNLSISPSGTLSVAVGPGSANTLGAVYQTLPDDTATFGGGPYGSGTALPADATQILAQGLTNINLPAIAVSPGTSAGQTVDDLIECQVQTVDQTPQSVNFVSSSGVVTPSTANRDRADIIVCQNKASASAATPVVPTVDSGWVGIGYVAVPYNTTTITGGMIFPLTGSLFYGFSRASSPGAVAIDTSATAQVKAGALGMGAPGSYNANGLQVGSGYVPGAYSGLISSSSLTAGGVTGDYLGIYENGSLNALGLALDHSGNLGVAGVLKASGGATFPGLTTGNCVQVGSGGVLQTASGPCGLGSGTITSISPGSNVSVTGTASAPTVGVVNAPTFPGVVTASAFTAGSSTLTPTGLLANGNVTAANGIHSASAGSSLQLCPNNNCSVGVVISPTGTVTANGPVTATQFNGSAAGITPGSVPFFPNGSLLVGTNGAANPNAIIIGSGADPIAHGWIGSPGAVGMVDGISPDFLGLQEIYPSATGPVLAAGGYVWAIDRGGNMGVLGTIAVGGPLNPTAGILLGQSGVQNPTAIFLGSQYTGAAHSWLGTSITTGAVGTIFPEYFGIQAAGGVGYALSLDHSGNLGIAGTLHAASTLKVKRDVRALDPDWALAESRKFPLVSFCLKTETPKECGPGGKFRYHLSYAGEWTPWEISGKHHDQVDPVSLAALSLAAVKALDKQSVVAAKTRARGDAQVASHEKRLTGDESQISALWLQVKVLYAILVLMIAYLVFDRRRLR